jgi:hypothetical protein
MRTRTLLISAAALALLLGAAGFADAQCAMCKTVLMGSPEGRHLSESLNRAILLMFFAPYAVFGTFVAFFLRKRWQPAVARAARRLTGRDHDAR